eukprot:TRINITY_DN13745_c0_g2_i1.p1 TRINITY_DN13745_c0_g2~~TRINITY_DN13745_c0_g2_i1.p1  ORF type:complete len:1183 (+),score=150.03 TRINITY_DN13745_c0_g2_i1:25-3573(+)
MKLWGRRLRNPSWEGYPSTATAVAKGNRSTTLTYLRCILWLGVAFGTHSAWAADASGLRHGQTQFRLHPKDVGRKARTKVGNDLVYGTDVFANASARCSFDLSEVIFLPQDLPCPRMCPFSQPLEGGNCEKVCVEASHCHTFHPVRFFANTKTLRCEVACGDQHRVVGCHECASVGVCKRCSSGLFGLLVLELSEDGRECIAPRGVWWYLFFSVAGVVSIAAALYVLELSTRDVQNAEVLRKALERRECARTELMSHKGSRDMSFFTANMHCDGSAPDWLGGRGVALYFNWLIFGIVVAIILGVGCFIAFEFSELAVGRGKQHKCSGLGAAGLNEDGVSTGLSHDGTHFLASQVDSFSRETHVSSLSRSSSPALAPVAVAVVDSPASSDSVASSSITSPPLEEPVAEILTGRRAIDSFEGYTDVVLEELRGILSTVPGRQTQDVNAMYHRFHIRMFWASIGMYAVVSLLALGYAAWQLLYTSARFDAEPSVRKFTAVVSGLPTKLLDGMAITQHFRSEIDREGKEELWYEHAGKSAKHLLATIPLDDRCHVVGTSIAYDFHDHQESILREVDSWVQALEGWVEDVKGSQSEGERQSNEGGRRPDLSRVFSPAEQDGRASRGVQTETRGDIIDTLHTEWVDEFDNMEGFARRKAFFENIVLKMVGLREESPENIGGSGKAFVVFSTQAARDAVVDMARHRRLAPMRFKIKNGRTQWHKLIVEPASCEPVSVNWENFSRAVHFPQKLFLGVTMMCLTFLVWVFLYLPYAAYYAEILTIPGLQPVAAQEYTLGVLIAFGNVLLQTVIEKVAVWAGFLYKHNRDTTVLTLAFLGTLVNTSFDLAIVALAAQGTKSGQAFMGRETTFDSVVANELFHLIVPGYLFVPAIGCPIVERVLPFLMCRLLIRTHASVKLRRATVALQSPSFDICWRYADILNNTTICACLLFFSSSRSWKVMVWLLLFILLVYCIDKYLLLNCASTTIYDTDILSSSFARWWCLPTALLAIVAMYWGYKAGMVRSPGVCVACLVIHVVVFLTAMLQVEWFCEKCVPDPRLYPDAVREMRGSGRPWDFFNTNPVFCLRTRFLEPASSGWLDICSFMDRYPEPSAEPKSDCSRELTPGTAVRSSPKRGSSCTFAQATESPRCRDGRHQKSPEECVPFSRGSVWLLKEARTSLARSGSVALSSA